jgi:cell division protein FtsZ
MKDAFELVDTYNKNVVIKVISVSESGDDDVRHMGEQINGVDFVHLDAIGNTNIREILNGTDMVFLIGVTSETEIKAIAQIAFEYDVLMLAIVTTPLAFEIDKKLNITELLCSSNALLESIEGITDTVVNAGMINIDLEDIRTVLFGQSHAIIGSHSASGENRATAAIQQAMSSPLFGEINWDTVQGVVANISASDMFIRKFDEVGCVLQEKLSNNEDVTIKLGTSVMPDAGNVMTVSVVVAI